VILASSLPSSFVISASTKMSLLPVFRTRPDAVIVEPAGAGRRNWIFISARAG
jgi:hypothetical protein